MPNFVPNQVVDADLNCWEGITKKNKSENLGGISWVLGFFFNKCSCHKLNISLVLVTFYSIYMIYTCGNDYKRRTNL